MPQPQPVTSKEEALRQALADVPSDFYGVVEIHFVKGVPTHTKVTVTRKLNSNISQNGTAQGNHVYQKEYR